jgi:hypothetical protein
MRSITFRFTSIRAQLSVHRRVSMPAACPFASMRLCSDCCELFTQAYLLALAMYVSEKSMPICACLACAFVCMCPFSCASVRICILTYSRAIWTHVHTVLTYAYDSSLHAGACNTRVIRACFHHTCVEVHVCACAFPCA